MSPFLQPEDSFLRLLAQAVAKEEILSEEIQRQIDQMLAVAQPQRTDSTKRGLVGLAAPQIGIGKRIIIVDVGIDETRKDFGEIKVYINPQITWKSPEEAIGREGCFSVDAHVAGLVPRSTKIKIAAFDREANPIEEELAGFTARIFQHEVDHLDGIRFPDRVGKTGVLHWIADDQFLSYRENWKDWPVRCSWDTWLNMQEGKPYTSPDGE